VRDRVTMALYLREVDLLSHGEYVSADMTLDEILLVKASLACDSACATPTKNVEQGAQPLVVTLNPSRAPSRLQRKQNCLCAFAFPTGLCSTSPGLSNRNAPCDSAC
jgi:hypothetical protein